MPLAKTILVAGRTGQLARCLSLISEQKKFDILAIGRPELDISNATSINSVFDKVQPAIVINAAAYTAVDKAENDSDEAYRINCEGAANLATAAARRNLALVHISTDYVFDGSLSTPYLESAPTNPLGVYGNSKRAGEIAVLAAHPGAVVLRTSWLYSAFGSNFLKTMIRLAISHSVVRVVNDQRGSPTSAHDLAAALLTIGSRLSQPNAWNCGGIYHLTATNETTWYGFADAIFACLKSRGMCVPPLKPIESAEYPTSARRPSYSVLDCTKVEHEFGVRLPTWRQALKSHFDTFAVHKETQPC